MVGTLVIKNVLNKPMFKPIMFQVRDLWAVLLESDTIIIVRTTECEAGQNHQCLVSN